MIASVSGRRSVTSCPCRARLTDVDRAAHAFDRAPHDVHADAAARQRGNLARRRKAGMEDELMQLGVGDDGAGRDQAVLFGLGADALRCRGRLPSSETLISTSAPAWRATRRMWPTAGLPAARRVLGALQTVVGGVADDVDQRIGEPLDHRLVELGLLALGDRARSPCRDRARGRGRAGGSGQTASRSAACGCPSSRRASEEVSRSISSATPLRVGADGGELAEARLGDHQFADAVHHLVEPLGLHADGGGVLADGAARRRFGRAAAAGGRLRPSGATAAGFAGFGGGRGGGGRDFLDCSRSISPATKMKTSSMALRGCARRRADVPGEIAGLRVDLVERRRRGGVDHDPAARRAASSSRRAGDWRR